MINLKPCFGNISINVVGSKSCNFSCKYCCLGDGKGKDNVQIDYNKLKLTIDRIKAPSKLSFNLWGSELFTENKFNKTKELIEWLLTTYPDCAILISTNGKYISLHPEKIQFVIGKKIRLQLSHDGCGQKLRSKFDPLDYPIWRTLANTGNLYNINCVMNNENYSFFKNIQFFESKLHNYTFFGIRLWMINDEESDLRLRGLHLKKYISELKQLMKFYIENPSVVDRYKSGILSILAQQNNNNNSCVDFHNGKTNYNYCVDTLGRFCDCQLLDGSEKVKNRNHLQPNYCKKCKYKKSNACSVCGVSFFPKKCEYRYALNKLLDWVYKKYKLDIQRILNESGTTKIC